uniref:Uncharacterized protein n=1 Tax=Rhizophora mucronata TaxID=61149 RepID=A0A2P2Q9B4_RHIMU
MSQFDELCKCFYYAFYLLCLTVPVRSLLISLMLHSHSL